MKIPATIVTGFLGSGKTSLIRHLLEQADGRRLALIVNEFGDMGADGEIIKGCGIPACDEDDVIELANGCICCTVADDFLPAMRKILAREPRPDHILIETSGLALPKPLVKAFTWPEVRNAVTVDGVIVLTDAEAVRNGRFAHDPDAVAAQREADPSLDHESPLEELFEEQILCGDLIVLNKADCVEERQRAAVEAEIAPHLRPGVRVLWTTQGRLDPRVALGMKVGAEDDLDSRPSHHDAGEDHDHDEFDSFVLDVPPVADPAEVERRLHAAIERFDILRVKGFLAVEGRPLRHVVQAVGRRLERYYDRPWKDGEARQGALVVIGQRDGTAGLDRTAIRSIVLEGDAA